MAYQARQEAGRRNSRRCFRHRLGHRCRRQGSARRTAGAGADGHPGGTPSAAAAAAARRRARRPMSPEQQQLSRDRQQRIAAVLGDDVDALIAGLRARPVAPRRLPSHAPAPRGLRQVNILFLDVVGIDGRWPGTWTPKPPPSPDGGGERCRRGPAAGGEHAVEKISSASAPIASAEDDAEQRSISSPGLADLGRAARRRGAPWPCRVRGLRASSHRRGAVRRRVDADGTIRAAPRVTSPHVEQTAPSALRISQSTCARCASTPLTMRGSWASTSNRPRTWA